MLMDLYVAGSSSCSLSCHSSLCTAFSAAASCCCLIKRHVWFKIETEVIEIFEKIFHQVWTREISRRASLVIANNFPSIYLEICSIVRYTTRQQKLGFFLYWQTFLCVASTEAHDTAHKSILYSSPCWHKKNQNKIKVEKLRSVPLICQIYHQRPAAMTWTVLH